MAASAEAVLRRLRIGVESGESAAVIAAALNAEGIAAPRAMRHLVADTGGRWTGQAVGELARAVTAALEGNHSAAIDTLQLDVSAHLRTNTKG